MSGTIHVDEASLNDLKQALSTAGQEYKREYANLSDLISQITNGSIKGDPANDLRNKYEAKKETFQRLLQTIEEAEEYMGMQTQKFSDMIGGLSSGMR